MGFVSAPQLPLPISDLPPSMPRDGVRIYRLSDDADLLANTAIGDDVARDAMKALEAEINQIIANLRAEGLMSDPFQIGIGERPDVLMLRVWPIPEETVIAL